MLTLAYRNLVQEKLKLFISIIGVAFSVLLMMVLMGVYQGLSTKLGEYIKTVPADLWVAQTGSKNLFDSTSVLSASAKEDIGGVEGVATVKTFNGRQIAVTVEGKEKRAFVVGLGTESGAVAPKIIAGTADIKQGEIILDKSIKGVELGQQVTVAGETFKVAGITEGGNVLIVTYAFMHSEDAAKLFKLTDVVNYFTVTVDPGSDPGVVAKKIEMAVPGTIVQNGPDFISNTTSIVKEVFLPIISVLSLIGALVGVTVIGLTIFTSTLEKAKEYAVLKAIGIRNSQLYRIVLQQSLLTSVLGFLVGAVLGLVLMSLASEFVPEFVASVRPVDVGLIFIATLVMGSVAALIPAHRLTKIDPAEVFKA